jgi:hypothetical protein
MENAHGTPPRVLHLSFRPSTFYVYSSPFAWGAIPYALTFQLRSTFM